MLLAPAGPLVLVTIALRSHALLHSPALQQQNPDNGHGEHRRRLAPEMDAMTGRPRPLAPGETPIRPAAKPRPHRRPRRAGHAPCARLKPDEDHERAPAELRCATHRSGS